MSELEWQRPQLERVMTEDDAEQVASRWRLRLTVTLETQTGWRSASAAFDAWRAALEGMGITVAQFSMGADACRGFSVWDDRSPLVAVNTAWRDEARSFTLFHELAHLLTRTDSACATAPMTPHAGDTVERWCEGFAAAVLIPATALSNVTRIDSLAELSALARRLRVSIRAMALRLIGLRKRHGRSIRASRPPPT